MVGHLDNHTSLDLIPYTGINSRQIADLKVFKRKIHVNIFMMLEQATTC